MMSDRKQYTAEFKRDAVRLMTEGKQSSSQVSRTLGVNVSLLGKWGFAHFLRIKSKSIEV